MGLIPEQLQVPKLPETQLLLRHIRQEISGADTPRISQNPLH